MGAGFPDFTVKGTSPIDLIDSVTVNTNGTQTEDITALVTPAHQGLLFVWIANLAFLGGSIRVSVGANLNSTLLVPDSEIPDDGQLIVPFPAIFITDNIGNTCTLSITLPAGVPGPAVGTLLVFGVTGTPFQVPAIRRQYIGRGETTGLLSIAGAATTTVISNPRAGNYYRIKMMQWMHFAAPAAVSGIQFERLSDFAVIFEGNRSLAAVDGAITNPDYQMDSGIRVHNFGSNAAFIVIQYEIWPV